MKILALFFMIGFVITLISGGLAMWSIERPTSWSTSKDRHLRRLDRFLDAIGPWAFSAGILSMLLTGILSIVLAIATLVL